MNRKLQKLLYKSFDAELTKTEASLLNDTLKTSDLFRKEKEEIENLRKTVSNTAEKSFSPLFTGRVLQAIEKPENNFTDSFDEFFDSLLLSFRRISLAGAVVVLMLLANNFISADTISLDTALSLQQVSIEDVWSLNDLLTEAVK